MSFELIGLIIALCSIFLFSLVFLVLRLRLKTKLRPAEPQSVAELIPESKFVTVDGRRIHYVQAGQGPELILLHGIGASLFIWRYLFPLLQVRYRVTAIDLPGFGKSDKSESHDYGLDAQTKLVSELALLVGIKHATYIGSSMGGAIALWMASRFPQMVDKVVAIAPAADSRLSSSHLQRLAFAAPLFRYTVNRSTMRLFLGFVTARPERINDRMIESYLEPFRDRGEGVRSFVAATSLLSDKRLPRELKNISCDVLILWGAGDQMVREENIRPLIDTIPHGKLITHPQAGHHIMEDEPVWLARQIEEFLA